MGNSAKVIKVTGALLPHDTIEPREVAHLSGMDILTREKERAEGFKNGLFDGKQMQVFRHRLIDRFYALL